MRTLAIKAISRITVLTKHTKALWEIVIDNPIIDSICTSANFSSMDISAAVYMVYTKELNYGFAAAIAVWFVTFRIMPQYQHSFFSALIACAFFIFFILHYWATRLAIYIAAAVGLKYFLAMGA